MPQNLFVDSPFWYGYSFRFQTTKSNLWLEDLIDSLPNTQQIPLESNSVYQYISTPPWVTEFQLHSPTPSSHCLTNKIKTKDIRYFIKVIRWIRGNSTSSPSHSPFNKKSGLTWSRNLFPLAQPTERSRHVETLLIVVIDMEGIRIFTGATYLFSSVITLKVPWILDTLPQHQRGALFSSWHMANT